MLRNAIADQEIESFVTFELTTEAAAQVVAPKKDDPFVGGGTANIGFLQGTDDRGQFDNTPGNAHAIKMTVRYWIETVVGSVNVKPNVPDVQEFPMVSAAGVLGPTFFVGPTLAKTITAPTKKRVTWTQIQYSQNVTLNFSTLGWPHISVATLGDTSRIEITDLK